ncbi:MAG TPA: hypothetical protein VF516_41365 [Kofleriaceae bacterium]
MPIKQVNSDLWLLRVGLRANTVEEWFQVQPFGVVRWFNALVLSGRAGNKGAEVTRVFDVDNGAGLETHVVFRVLPPSPEGASIAIYFAETV